MNLEKMPFSLLNSPSLNQPLNSSFSASFGSSLPLLIISILVIIIALIMLFRSNASYENYTTLSNEAIQNIASVYNSNPLSVNNITATDASKTNSFAGITNFTNTVNFANAANLNSTVTMGNLNSVNNFSNNVTQYKNVVMDSNNKLLATTNSLSSIPFWVYNLAKDMVAGINIKDSTNYLSSSYATLTSSSTNIDLPFSFTSSGLVFNKSCYVSVNFKSLLNMKNIKGGTWGNLYLNGTICDSCAFFIGSGTNIYEAGSLNLSYHGSVNSGDTLTMPIYATNTTTISYPVVTITLLSST